MVRTRCLDDKVNELVARGVGIMQHSTRGQEATPIAACAALAPRDYMFPYHRGWAWAIGKGMDPKTVLAELMGKRTGCCRGKGGVHLADWDLRVMGRPGVQGAHVPIATGVALASKLRGDGDVVLCFFGEGASNEGNIHEGMNMAAVWKVPLVFVVENNGYAVYTTTKEAVSVDSIAKRGAAYDMPAEVVDGNDPEAVYGAVRTAVERARSGGGPSIVEAMTYRLLGHMTADTFFLGGYRPKEEVEAWQAKCPIRRLREKLLRTGVASEADLAAIENAAAQEIEAAERFATDSPYPTKEELLHQDIYAD
jgi:pyruvate dehydrogenase E1 component alpha subunit